jgi:hypothetical protein
VSSGDDGKLAAAKDLGTVVVCEQKFLLVAAIGSHACCVTSSARRQSSWLSVALVAAIGSHACWL